MKARREQQATIVVAAPKSTPRRTNGELLSLIRAESSSERVRSEAAEALRRQIKSLCAAALSRQSDGLSANELEDLTQDVLIRLLQSPAGTEPNAAYVARIAANLLIDRRRHIVRRGQNAPSFSLDEPMEDGGARDVADPTMNLESQVLTRLAEGALRTAVERLLKPAEARVVLRRAEGAAHDEIAAETGQSCASIRKQYERGLKRLQTIAQAGLLPV